jgi:hypothetical protein
MATAALTLADDGPVLLTLEAVTALLARAFAGMPRLVGPPMTVHYLTFAAGAPPPKPTCRLFAPDEYLDRLAQTARANAWADTPMDRYGFRIEYMPVASTSALLADVERQAFRDSWLVQKTLSDAVNIAVIGSDGSHVGAELARQIHVRNNVGMYAQDGAQVVIQVEGEFTVRKSLLPSTGI